MAKQTNPFLEFDMTKMMREMKVPGFNVDAVVSAQKKNAETMIQANRLAFEGMQALMKRQVELVRQTIEEASSAASKMTDTTSPTEQMAKQTGVAKDLFEQSQANLKELAEMMAKSNNEIVDLLNKRFAEVLTEMQDAIEKAPQQTFDLSAMIPKAAAPAAAPEQPAAPEKPAAKAASSASKSGGQTGRGGSAGKSAAQ